MSEQEMRDVAIPVELLFRVPDLLSVSARNDQIKGLERFVEDVSHGVKWVPWSDGRAIGFRCEHPDGRVEYVYLNPSSDSDDGTSNVFVYQGTEGDPVQDPAYTHYVMFQEDSDA